MSIEFSKITINPSFIESPASLSPLSMDGKIKEFVEENMAHLIFINRAELPGIKYYRNGNHHTVFAYDPFPGLIFKIMEKSNALSACNVINSARTIIAENHMKYCHVPSARVIELDDPQYHLLAMEKADAMTNPYECLELSELAYEKFDEDPQLEEKWLQFFTEAALFICLTGQFDVCWNNVLLNLEKGFYFIDWEGDLVSTPFRCSEGLRGLIDMAPARFWHSIFDLSYQIGSSCAADLIKRAPSKTQRKNELQLHSELRKWHQSKGIVSIVPIETSIDLSEMEKEIINKFNQAFIQYGPESQKGCLIEQRKFWWLPFSKKEGIPIEKKKEFEQALESLQKLEILFAWTSEKTSYTLYF